MSLRSEIFEQPEVLARLMDVQMKDVERTARSLKKRKIDFIFLAARGTSDNAGLYAKYLWGAYNQLPIALAAPSLFSVYKKPPCLTNALVVGISQSGKSPDILSVIDEANRQGTPTLAITNDPRSHLAKTSEFMINTSAGPEKAVAATKTYTTQLLAVAMLSIALKGDKKRLSELQGLPEMVENALKLDPAVEQAAKRYRNMEKCVILGRGYNYCTAYEWSLKLKELVYIFAQPYSSADFQHGPVAVISQGFFVLAVVPAGEIFKNMMGLLSDLVENRQVKLLAISNRQEALSLAQTSFPLPNDMSEWLSPLVSIVPAQLFCYHLTRSKGFDTEKPRGLSKITLTR